MTVREYRLREQGYNRVLNEQRRQTRWLGYQIIRGWADPDKLPGIAEIWPIEGDPTPEEIEAANKQKEINDKKWANELVEKLVQNGKLKRNPNWKKDSK